MKCKITIFVVLLILLLFAAAFRFVQVSLDSIGAGRGIESPNKKMYANAESWSVKTFWGKRMDYDEFTVTSSGGKRLGHVIVDDSPKGGRWYDDGLIEWATNSSSVTFSNEYLRVVLMVNP